MKRRPNLTATCILLCNLLGLFLLASWNDIWARLGLHFHLPSLFFLFAALRLDRRRGILVTFLTGLFIDAIVPGPFFGFHAFALVACDLVAREWGEAFRPLRGRRPLLFLQATNATVLLLLSVWRLVTVPAEAPGLGGHLSADLLASQLFLLPAGAWFLAFQREV